VNRTPPRSQPIDIKPPKRAKEVPGTPRIDAGLLMRNWAQGGERDTDSGDSQYEDLAKFASRLRRKGLSYTWVEGDM
jgi:hypothetical protein